MGLLKCAVPGCTSRGNKGISFKRLPTRNAELARKWRVNFPPLTEKSYVCELHFDSSQYEKPREDGKKRLKDLAVPSIQSFQVNRMNRPALGDISNLCDAENFQSLKTLPSPLKDHSYSKFLKANNENIDPSFAPLKECQNSIKCEEVVNNVFDSTSSSVDDAVILLDEPSPSHVLPSLIDNEENVTYYLSEETGQLVRKEDVINIPCNTNLLPSCNPHQFINSEGESVTCENILSLLADQNTRIAELQKIVEEQEERNRKAKKNEDKMRKKSDAQKTKIAYLNRKLHNGLAPWLHSTQKKVLFKKCTRGVKWDPEMIRKGLVLKMRCGTAGYSAFVSACKLYPSVRTLQRSVQFLQFESGILHGVFDILEVVVNEMPELDRDCNIVLDEMKIQAGERYDLSTKKWVGRATLPSHDGIGTKGLVFLLAGCRQRWKISVAAYLTRAKEKIQSDSGAVSTVSASETGKAYKTIIHSIIECCEKINLKVRAVISDMGPDNLAMWREFGIVANRKEIINVPCPNPVVPFTSTFVLPDAIHLYKAIKTMMENNGIITLTDDIVREERLSAGEINYKHIEDLLEFEENFELKVAFRLKRSNVNCNKQFKKMSVSTTRAVICHRTKVGLELLAEEKNQPSYLATAWFINLLNVFFEIVTCRHKGLAVSKYNIVVYEKVINLIKLVRRVFQTMKVGKKGEWKPCQRGMVVLCTNLLELIHYFLEVRGYKYIMLGRFLSDCIENLFSLIRLSMPIPHAVAFFMCLKVITLAQLSEAIKGSSYDYDESVPFANVDILAEARKRAAERAEVRFFASLDELFSNPVQKLTEVDFCKMERWQKCVVYAMAGAAVHAVISSNSILCSGCVDSLKWKDQQEKHPYAALVESLEFTTLRSQQQDLPKLIYVSNEVFRAIMIAELTFKMYRMQTLNFKNSDVKKYFVDNLMYVWDGTTIPQCHFITRKVLDHYIESRLKEFGKKRAEEIKEAQNQSVDRSSKSVAMRDAASNITVARHKK